ncbi:MAG: hypothetical protein PGN13_02325, partial [Patulibacter minatonensis]
MSATPAASTYSRPVWNWSGAESASTKSEIAKMTNVAAVAFHVCGEWTMARRVRRPRSAGASRRMPSLFGRNREYLRLRSPFRPN